MHPVSRLLPAALSAAFFAISAQAQAPPQSIGSLKKVAIPAPTNVATYVRDPAALVALGKALFWDVQVGSDGKVACATCHFHAGADHRIQNQLSNSLGKVEPNRKLTAADFPFHQLADPTTNASRVLRDSTQVAGSSGMFARRFTGIVPGLPLDDGADIADGTFRVGNLNLRQVTGRNAPSAINAAFNFRNFWDGRASNVFTGLTPFGLSDTRPNVLSNASGGLKLEPLRIENASLASQAVGPVLGGLEMSYDARSWPKVGKKLLALRPLAAQRIAADDSVLGQLANAAGRGFRDETTYLDLIKVVFQPAYWNSTQFTDESGNVLSVASSLPPESQFSQAEINFAIFFGLAVQAYESTLIADDSRVDRFGDGQVNALSSTEIAGMRLFTGPTGCNACHSGPELTLASYTGVNGRDPLKSGADTGFFHVGERPIGDDAGLGGLDGFGKPLSSTFPTDANSPASAQGRFKTPGLRNIEFTGPYFHDGGQATLEQVIEFYNRGGNFSPNGSNGPNVRRLALSTSDQAAIVAFMKALSDDRVRFERAPFDHPELCVANGQVQASGSNVLQPDGNPAFSMSAADRWVGLPPVGRGGNTVPLQTFEELLAGVGADGSRAHNLSDACGIEALTATGFVNQNAAAAKTGALAQNSIATAFGTNFAKGSESAATNPPPTTLAGVTLNVQDSAGVTRSAPLFYASSSQINYAIPEGTAVGSALVSLAGASTVFRAPVRIAKVSPGLFGTPQGLAAANVLTFRDGAQTSTNVLSADAAGNLALVPIDLGPSDQQVFLVLYGTGIRNYANPVTATIGTAAIPAAFAGAQGTFPGEDQINILLPQTLRGAGIVDVTLNVDGLITNAVKIQIQ